MLIRSLSLMLLPGLVLLPGLALTATSSFPALTYSTYLRDSFTPKAIATDTAGNVYMAGSAVVDPATSQSTALVVKLNPQGTQYVYVRYLGGSVSDSANAIAVDAAGNAYVAGSTASPDFPVTKGGNLGTAPTGAADRRSFVAKFDADGGLVFSDLVGGSAASSAQAVAVNSGGQAIVSGIVSIGSGAAFPSTAGAYSVANTANHPYLLELDPGGTKVVFSATGIGGNALAVDPSGNIYVAGSTNLLDYPTTPGAYQSTFPVSSICLSPPCSAQVQAANQYVTKLDSTGSKMIYSTALTGTGNTTNGGMAVDAVGNVYLTGYAGAKYPYTVTPPAIPIGPIGNVFFFELPFLSKLDAAGKSLLFSVVAGGSGVQVDSKGAVYAGGGVGSGFAGSFGIPALPVLANIPAQCLPDNSGSHSAGYVVQADGESGTLLGTQFLEGSTLVTSGLALSGSTVWIAGATTLPDFPFTTNIITLPNLPSTRLAGAYLGAVDFSEPQPSAGTPQVFCVVDAADLTPAGTVGRNQLLTMLGTGLGPATGVDAADNSTTTLAGVNLSVGGVAAPLLYASTTQLNFAVPLVSPGMSLAPMHLTVNGVSAQASQIPLTFSPGPSLFVNTAQPPVSGFGSPAIALNEDGSMNSATNPANLGSTVSIFVNGLAPDPRITTAPVQLSTINGWSVNGIAAAGPFVTRVDLRVPSPLVNNFFCSTANLCGVGFALYNVSGVSSGQTVTSVGEAFGGLVYVSR